MKRFFLPIAVAASMLLTGCGGSSNSSHGSVTPPPPPPPPPPTTSFTSYVITLLGQTANSAPSEINNIMLSFPDQNNPAAFDSVVGSQ
jgi:hypothetical protein